MYNVFCSCMGGVCCCSNYVDCCKHRYYYARKLSDLSDNKVLYHMISCMYMCVWAGAKADIRSHFQTEDLSHNLNTEIYK